MEFYVTTKDFLELSKTSPLLPILLKKCKGRLDLLKKDLKLVFHDPVDGFFLFDTFPYQVERTKLALPTQF